MYNVAIAVFCPGYLEWWLDSMHLVLFIQYILLSQYMYYLRGGKFMMSGGYSRPVPTSVGRTLLLYQKTKIISIFHSNLVASHERLYIYMISNLYLENKIYMYMYGDKISRFVVSTIQ